MSSRVLTNEILLQRIKVNHQKAFKGIHLSLPETNLRLYHYLVTCITTKTCIHEQYYVIIYHHS
jgi:hypothetical protein